jgi:hypothetical protein
MTQMLKMPTLKRCPPISVLISIEGCDSLFHKAIPEG